MPSKKKLWASYIIQILVVIFLTFDFSIHLANPVFVQQAMQQLGWATNLAPVIGVIELLAVLLYVIPRTSILGAVLLTGYLGGAVATNLGAGQPLFGYILAPVYVGIFVWGALWLRDGRLREIFPVKR